MTSVIGEQKMSILALAEPMGLGDIDERVFKACNELFDTLIDTKRWLDESKRAAKAVIAHEYGDCVRL